MEVAMPHGVGSVAATCPCGKVVYRSPGHFKRAKGAYCSRAHAGLYTRKPGSEKRRYACPCGKEVWRSPSQLFGKVVHCSRRCAASAGYREERACEACRGSYRATSARQHWCATCVPDKVARARMQRYGISQPEWDHLLAAQGGACAICRATGPTVVDHCHNGGGVRGLLCYGCNLRLSALDSDGWLQRALAYLGRA